MPRHHHDFRTQAAHNCEGILIDLGLVKPDRSVPGYEMTPLNMSWPLVFRCVNEATQCTDNNGGEPDLNLVRRLLGAKVVPRLFSLFLDYPVPPVYKAAERPTHIARLVAVDQGSDIENSDVSGVHHDIG